MSIIYGIIINVLKYNGFYYNDLYKSGLYISSFIIMLIITAKYNHVKQHALFLSSIIKIYNQNAKWVIISNAYNNIILNSILHTINKIYITYTQHINITYIKYTLIHKNGDWDAIAYKCISSVCLFRLMGVGYVYLFRWVYMGYCWMQRFIYFNVHIGNSG